MILIFPNADTFHLVLAGGFLPAEVLAAPVTAAFEPAGRISVETEFKLAKKVQTELGRLGVTGAKRHLGDPVPMTCWPQIAPVARDAAEPQLSSQAPVLFELEQADDLSTIVGEMLRLGNDRQSLRWLGAADSDADRRVLLRVIGPPYYTLLRAIDRTASGTAGRVRAYLEQAPRVWVEIGHRHPFAAQIQVGETQSLLLRPERDWLLVPETPFQDVYEVLSFPLPNRPIDWSDVPSEGKLVVPLRLVAGNATEVPELWVLRGESVGQFDAFVRDADDRITSRLKFAVAEDGRGQTAIVLRTVASKLAPPILPLTDVVGFKPYFKLPNLYLPVGTRLHPTLRRDAVRKLLADDTDQLVWLYPTGQEGFTPETLPEDSFRPLEEWVDYVIESNAAPLKAWLDASQFEFEHFVCKEPAAGAAPKPPDERDPKARKRPGKGGDADEGPLAPAAAKTPAKKSDEGVVVPLAPPIEVKKPSEWLARRQELEGEFLSTEGPLDTPERLALWPDLAVANTGYGDTQEAAVCWLNALWEPELRPDATPDAWRRGWLTSEWPAAPAKLDVPALDNRMKPPEPSAGEMRHFAAVAFALLNQTPLPEGVLPRLAAVRGYLEAHEAKLPVRAAWLLHSRLAALAGSDTLGLARARDRILQRLLEDGLKPERDLPFFLRTAGLKDSERLRQVRDKALELHATVRAWVETSLKQPVSTGQPDQNGSLAYVDLFFAYGFAKLGETAPARALVDSAKAILEGYEPAEERGVAGQFLLKAYQSRVESLLAGTGAAGPLDPKLLETLDEIYKKSEANQRQDNPARLAHYAISRMREQSRILEPQEKLDPYHQFMKENDELRKALTELPRQRDPALLSRTIRDLYRNGVNGKATPDGRFLVLVNALLLAGRVGEQFTVELLSLVPEAMKAVGTAGQPQQTDLHRKQGQLLERGLFLAAHFDRREVVQQLVDQFVELVKTKSEEQRYELINVAAGQSLKSLRRLGLRDEIDRFLRRMQEVILAGNTPAKLREKHAGKPELWGKSLRSLLTLAGGWLTFGLTEQANPILDLARTELLGPGGLKLAPKDYTPLAQAYVAALGQGPADAGLQRIAELFRAMEPGKIVNSFTTSKFYSRFHLNLVEEVVNAVVSDDFALGSAGRRWLDEDEFLIRRRIHRDMRRQLATSGL